PEGGYLVALDSNLFLSFPKGGLQRRLAGFGLASGEADLPAVHTFIRRTLDQRKVYFAGLLEKQQQYATLAEGQGRPILNPNVGGRRGKHRLVRRHSGQRLLKTVLQVSRQIRKVYIAVERHATILFIIPPRGLTLLLSGQLQVTLRFPDCRIHFERPLQESHRVGIIAGAIVINALV